MPSRHALAALLLLAACAAQDSGPRYANIEPERWKVRVGVPSFGEPLPPPPPLPLSRSGLASPRILLFGISVRFQCPLSVQLRIEACCWLQIHTRSGSMARAAGRGRASRRAVTTAGRQSGPTCPTAATGAPAEAGSWILRWLLKLNVVVAVAAHTAGGGVLRHRDRRLASCCGFVLARLLPSLSAGLASCCP